MNDVTNAETILCLFEKYELTNISHLVGVKPDEHTAFRVYALFDAVCTCFLDEKSLFIASLPDEFKIVLRRYAQGDTDEAKRFLEVEIRIFCLSDLFDYIALFHRTKAQSIR